MLLPKYSIRLLLMITVGVALFALLITYAMRGYLWTLGVAVAVGSLFIVAVMHLALFLAVSLTAQLSQRRTSTGGREPAADPPAPLPEVPH
jgi:hypothetical protein